LIRFAVTAAHKRFGVSPSSECDGEQRIGQHASLFTRLQRAAIESLMAKMMLIRMQRAHHVS
jgi:hypothetical protein